MIVKKKMLLFLVAVLIFISCGEDESGQVCENIEIIIGVYNGDTPDSDQEVACLYDQKLQYFWNENFIGFDEIGENELLRMISNCKKISIKALRNPAYEYIGASRADPWMRLGGGEYPYCHNEKTSKKIKRMIDSKSKTD